MVFLGKRRCLDFSIKTMYHLGLWLDSSEPPPWRHPLSRLGYYWRHLAPRVVIVRMLYGSFFQIINLTIVWGDLFKMTEHYIAYVIHILIFIKCATFYFNRVRLARMCDLLEELSDQARLVDKKQREIVQSLNRFCYMFGKYGLFVLVSVSIVITLLMVPEMYARRTFSFRLWFPYDAYTTPMYELTLAFISVAQIFDTNLIPIFDAFFFVLCANIAVQFTILRLRVEGVVGGTGVEAVEEGEDGGLEMRRSRHGEGDEGGTGMEEGVEEGVEENEEMEIRIVECVKTHEILFGLTSDLQLVFRKFLVVQLYCNLSIGIAALYVSSMASNMDVKVVATMFMVFIACLEFLGFCWVCDWLTVESMLVSEAAYNCDWLSTTKSFRSSLRIIMVRSERALRITAAGVPLSMQTFRAVGRTAYYFHTMISNIFNGKKIGLT